jgi:hypothetical protein
MEADFALVLLHVGPDVTIIAWLHRKVVPLWMVRKPIKWWKMQTVIITNWPDLTWPDLTWPDLTWPDLIFFLLQWWLHSFFVNDLVLHLHLVGYLHAMNKGYVHVILEFQLSPWCYFPWNLHFFLGNGRTTLA